VTFFIPGTPAPQGSKRHVGNGVLIESSKHVGPWRERIAWFAAQNMHSRFTGAVNVRLEFVMPRPKSLPQNRTPAAIKRPDVDKLARACLDSLSGIAYQDDSQVVGLHANKRIALPGEQPGCQITIQEGS
jgi:crossover junction endodeoxyribonuclease RusA